ncbi:MAG TPA: acyl-CoA dehydrogenase [Stellaceae bacterium]|nr:acyl-CoA dehydrogenase [Stellaceae bacterium]
MSGFADEDRRLLASSIERFALERYDFEHRRRLLATAEGFGREEWRICAELGWLGIMLPEAYGGSGAGLGEAAVVMEGIGRALMLEPFLATVVLGAGLVERTGDEQQREAVLSAVAAGTLILAFAHDEPESGMSRSWVRTAAVAADGGFVLTGRKSLVLHGAAADRIIVSARLGGPEGKLGLFLVDRSAPGLAVFDARMIDGRTVARLDLERVQVPVSAHLGADEAEPAVACILDRATAAVCAEALGAMAAINEATLAYVRTRHQFGRSIGGFQVLQHRLVDMNVALMSSRSIVAGAIAALDAGSPEAARLVSAAKVKVGRSGRFVGEQGVQLHGGMGMTDELPVGSHYKRLMMIDSLFGDAEWHLDRMADL